MIVATLAAAALGGCGGSHPDARGPGARVASAPVALGALDRSGAGHRFYEIYEPTGPVRGTMLVLHGGSWKDARGAARGVMATASLAFRAAGWRVANVSYSPGARPPGQARDPRPMVRDVLAFHDQIAHAFGGPICAYGESAGGYLAAMLAVERPTLRCAILAAAPLDLPRLLRTTTLDGRASILNTFGGDPRVLAQWSPARLWHSIPTAVFATAAANDATVPPSQLASLGDADPAVDGTVLAGAAARSVGSVPYMHSSVRRDAASQRLAALGKWLDQRAPAAGGHVTPATDVGASCAEGSARGAELMRSGAAWIQGATAGQPLVATRGCSGTSRWQDDGLSLWALPGGAPARRGAQATLTLTVSSPPRHLTASFRGFVAAPRQWEVGLFSSPGSSGPVDRPLAICVRGRCHGLRLVPTAGGGALLAASSSAGNPDLAARPPKLNVAVPAGTKRLAWRLRCVAPHGCALVPPAARRPRDPRGHPAIVSVYRVVLA